MKNASRPFKKLSPKEKEVAKIIKVYGGNAKELAPKAGVSQRTFEAHVRSIHNKTGTRDYAQIVIFAYENPAEIE